MIYIYLIILRDWKALNFRRGSFGLNKELIETAEETYMELTIPKKWL